MRAYWGLATDFLSDASSRLTRLKTGLAQHELTRDAALALQDAAHLEIEQFLGTLHQATQNPHDPQAIRLTERLISTGEMLLTLLEWARQSVEQLFAETDHTPLPHAVKPGRQPKRPAPWAEMGCGGGVGCIGCIGDRGER